MIVTPILTAVFEAQNESRLCRWLGKFYIGEEKLASKAVSSSGYLLEGGLYSRHLVHI